VAEGWFMDSANFTTHSVGTLKPNSRGVYDMYGNVWEWCQDWFDAKLPGGKVTDPNVALNASGTLHTVRGGSWFDPLSAYKMRYGLVPYLRAANTGFRLALVATH
jgi:formylglycine-generating enzyme required for sulfatase activity